MKNPLKVNALFKTPSNADELLSFADSFHGGQASQATILLMMTINFCSNKFQNAINEFADSSKIINPFKINELFHTPATADELLTFAESFPKGQSAQAMMLLMMAINFCAVNFDKEIMLYENTPA